jgi:mono/diheme cytochrome c family protein
MATRTKLIAAVTLVFASVTAFSACGTQGIQVAKVSPYYNGAVLFRDHCSGCHTLATVGASGSATSISSRLKTNGPNFNQRKEQYNQVIYAIENGGFSGAIMPENIVIGHQAQEVAQFLTKYSGLQAQAVPTVNIPAQGTTSSTSSSSTATALSAY